MEYTHGVKYTYLVFVDSDELTNVLNSEFPGWRDANFFEDFNGLITLIHPGAIAFKYSEDATQFYLKYGEKFGVKPTTNLWFNVERI